MEKDIIFYRSHPFKDMEVGGDPVMVDWSLQQYVHNYAAKTGKKFTTRTVASGGDKVLYVKRVK